MDYKSFLSALGFIPKENTLDILSKKYPLHNGYSIDIDSSHQSINYGDKIQANSKTTQNFSQPENFVVLECVNRLLEQGYKPENIVLEKTWAAGHGTSGRLDICVTHDDGSEYLLIECKTYGKEFDKAYSRLKRDGGQLFTYFKFSNKADIIMLYASELKGKEIIYRNEIIKIEDDYRIGDSKDFFEKWNKLTKDNGVFDSWVSPYNFVSKALTPKQLKPIRQEDSSFIFNRFLEILRHNVVSDKPNAFNKIFTLFLCKVYDEKSTADHEELKFQWLEGVDNHITFQLRLTDLYQKGMLEFLEKQVSDFSESELDQRFGTLFTGNDELKKQLKEEIIKLRLEKNNEFAIKEVFDNQSFCENAKVVKEIVELLQNYRIRYNKRQQYLSDFFELLLTTGLKQESGQFFTPVPIAQFIIKSLPVDQIINEKLQKGEMNNLLPYMIDYAAGSGHFVTEWMHEVQRIIDAKKSSDYIQTTGNKIRVWQDDHFDWATRYVYGIEKDYRLVKVGKVGCYLHGDGLANVILSDGLGSFIKTKEYKDLLTKTDAQFPQENKQFEVVISNPPYSVSSFKNTAREYYTEEDFELYSSLTDNSSEIECLFVERTKQLLKDGGVAGIILPSSILSNTGIYSRAREVILQYFDIVAITELGSNTFMATGTNTVVLFLRRRNNYTALNLKVGVNNFFASLQDVTLNGIEKPARKYVTHVWEGITFADYLTLIQKQPSDAVVHAEQYKEYRKKIKAKTEQEFWNKLIEVEQEKLYYFILAYPQKTVLVKSGDKDAEKRFLGYEFSFRRGSEGIHPIQRGKTIDECTRLFDAERFDNPEKASTYIYQAFNGNDAMPVHESLKANITQARLVDMLTFNRTEFEKNISLAVKKKVKIESKWESKRFGEVAQTIRGVTYSKGDQAAIETTKIILTADNITLDGTFEIKKKVFLENSFQISDEKKLVANDIFICFSSGSKEHLGKVAFIDKDTNYYAGGFMGIIRVNSKNSPKYLFQLLNTTLRQTVRDIGSGSNINNLSGVINEIQIPLPPLDIQKKIVDEIEMLEMECEELRSKIKNLKESLHHRLKSDTLNNSELRKLGDVCEMKAGRFVKVGDINNNFHEGLFPCYGGNGLRGYTKTFTHEGRYSLIGRQGALCGNVHLVDGKFHATEHALVVTPKLEVDTVWLYHKLVDINLNQYATGTAQPGLSVMNLITILIPLPPLSEQQRIVAEIEQVEAQINELEKELAAIPAQKETILKQYL